MKRVLLKLSGEVLMGGQDYGIDPEFVAELAKDAGFKRALAAEARSGVSPDRDR